MSLLQLIMELKGKPSSRFLRKGAFKELHFDTDFKLLYKEVDKVTKNVRLVPLAGLVYGLFCSPVFITCCPIPSSHPSPSMSTFLGALTCTSQEKITVMDLHKPTKDLMAMLLGDHKVAADDRRLLVHFRDLLEKMLMVDPEKRISIKEALNHPFIKEKLM